MSNRNSQQHIPLSPQGQVFANTISTPQEAWGQLAFLQNEPRINWQHWDRFSPGDYPAYSRHARIYFDRPFKRWVCLVIWDVLDEALIEVIGRAPWFLNLGNREKPYASRRSKAFAALCDAIGHAPARIDRPTARFLFAAMPSSPWPTPHTTFAGSLTRKQRIRWFAESAGTLGGVHNDAIDCHELSTSD